MKIPKHTTSPRPWKVKTRRTDLTKTLIVSVVDANGNVVIDEVKDEDGAVYADRKLIVECVNKYGTMIDSLFLKYNEKVKKIRREMYDKIILINRANKRHKKIYPYTCIDCKKDFKLKELKRRYIERVQDFKFDRPFYTRERYWYYYLCCPICGNKILEHFPLLRDHSLIYKINGHEVLSQNNVNDNDEDYHVRNVYEIESDLLNLDEEVDQEWLKQSRLQFQK